MNPGPVANDAAAIADTMQGPSRRDWIKLVGIGAMLALMADTSGFAGQAQAESPEYAPADKKLSPQWIRSLFDRGQPTVYQGSDLKFIGMPVGGVTAGHLYIGGDGKLWHWDIFNQHIFTAEEHYAKPMIPSSPLEQGFSIDVGNRTRTLDAKGFESVTFCGQYPIATIDYADANCPLAVKLEAFSPFVPLNVDDSSLPCTVLNFTLHNTSDAPVETTLTGTLENAICLFHRERDGLRSNRILRGDEFTFLQCSAEDAPETAADRSNQPDIVFEDWHSETYDGWTAQGTAFGRGPILKSQMPAYQGDVGGDTDRVVNSHASAPGNSVTEKDGAIGRLTSRPFTISRNFIGFWIGGGDFKDQTCMNLIVDGEVVRTAAGLNDNKMTFREWNVRRLKGKTAQLEIVDARQGPWGNIGIGRITLTDHSSEPAGLAAVSDFGTMGLALLGAAAEEATEEASAGLDEKLVGRIGRKMTIAARQSQVVTFVLTWHFPNLTMKGVKGSSGRHYATRFGDAMAVADYVVRNFDRLNGQTRRWRDTWYDSTLPFWFLDRTFLNISILATSTAYRFSDGRFYGWEGVGDCAGTCTHVWSYEQAMGRLFPELDVLLRERAEFNSNISFAADGMIDYRAEFHNGPAVDGQAGVILRSYRDHLTSADDAFLRRNWASIKKATQWLLNRDPNRVGILEGPQHNTLDTDWWGPVAWLSGMYLASVRAAEEMSKRVGDEDFARQCRAVLDAGAHNLTQKLFNGEYYICLPDPKHPESPNSGSGCEIDQLLGQSWAWQIGLGRIFPENQTKSALRSLWRYNFFPDVGPWREIHKPGRWYAMPGEAGLIMLTYPKPDWNYQKAKGNNLDWAARYFNECMNGFEHQVAGHMIWEGLVQEGLAVERAIHDRYAASRRNPWNEIECGDHYARSMASYGVFLAACGFEYDGPRGHIAFAPRLGAADFKAAFTAAQGWGAFSQKFDRSKMTAEIAVKYGDLRLRTIGISPPEKMTASHVQVSIAGKSVECSSVRDGARLIISLSGDQIVVSGQTLMIVAG